MQGIRNLSENTVGAAFELRFYGNESSRPVILLQAREDDKYYFFVGRSVKAVRKASVFFSNADTCYIRTQDGISRFHARPISDIKSLYPSMPDAQTDSTSTDNSPVTIGSDSGDSVDNKTLLPGSAVHPEKQQPSTSEDLTPPPELKPAQILNHSYTMSQKPLSSDTPLVGQAHGSIIAVAMTNDPAENVTSNSVAIVPDQDIFPLLALPEKILSRIMGHLSHRDVTAMKESCLHLREIAAPVLSVRNMASSRVWFKQFAPSQQQIFIQIAKNFTEPQLRAWLMQFTRDKMLVSHLCQQSDREVTDNSEARSPEKIPLFPQLLFYQVSQLMIDSPVLQPDLVAEIQCKSYLVETAILSHDASYLVTDCYGADGRAKIHALAAKNSDCQQIHIPHVGRVRQVICSADNRHILSFCTQCTVKITSRSDDDRWAEQLCIVHKKKIRSASFSPDSRHAVTVSGDKNAYISSVDQDGRWALTATIVHEGDVCSANFSPDSCLLVTASEDHTAKIHRRAANGKWLPITTLQHKNKVISAEFSPDSKHIITVWTNQTGKFGQTATIYSVNPDGCWTEKADITHSDRICSATFSPDSCHAVTASLDHTGTVFSFDSDNNWQKNALINHTGRVSSASFSPNSLLIITSSDDHSAKIFGFDTDHRRWTEQMAIKHEDKINSALFSADSRHILTLSSNDTSEPKNNCKAIIHSLCSDGQWLPGANIEPEGGVCSGQFNHDGTHVVINDFSGDAQILGCGKDGNWSRKALIRHPYSLKSSEFSANGSHLVTVSSRGKRIKVWRLCGVEAAPTSHSKGKRAAASSLLSPPPSKKARR
ncbi:F-box/WD repeat-containing protein [Endozoicomonas sp. 2B-B]